ncbi:MAG: hypothetical protein ACTSRW_00225 [Candidatus Helarchaeota archaeon]
MNLSISTLILFIATIPELMAVIISLYGYLRTRFPHFFYMFFTWIFLSLGNILIGFAYLFLNTTIYRVGILISAPLAFAIMGLVDSISREHVHAPKLFIISIISTVLFIFAFDLNSVVYNVSILGDITLAMTGPFMIAGSLTFIFSGLLWIYYMLKIHLNAPTSIKKYSLINLIGAILAGPGSFIAFSTGLVWIVPGTDYLFISCGAFLCAFSFWNQPELGYVLPFKAFRLMCINSESGVPIYTHDWDPTNVADDTLLSGAIQALSSILDEGLGKGFVREVKFDNGIMIINRVEDSNLMFVIISSKSSPILLHGLTQFGNDFIDKFRKEISAKLINMKDFSSADNLIKKNFPFLPTYSKTKTS